MPSGQLKTNASPEPPPSTARLEQVLAAKTPPPLGSGEPRGPVRLPLPARQEAPARRVVVAQAVEAEVDSTRSASTKYPAEVPETTPLRDTLPTGLTAPALGRPRALVDLAPGLALGAASDRVPPLPQPAVASGFIWPAATGRELLRNVPIDGAMLRSDSVVGSGETDAQPRIFVYEAGTWCLRTSSTLCFDSTDKARDALLSLVRRKISLGPLLMSDTVLTLQSDPQGGYWLWTVTPWVVTLEQALAEHLANPSRLEKLLVSYAGALMTGLRYAMRRRVCLSLEPANFAAFRGVTYYVGDEIRQGDWPVEIATRLLHPVEQFGEEATRSYVHELVQGLRADLRGTGGGDGLLSELSGLVTTEGLAVARRRLIEALARDVELVSRC